MLDGAAAVREEGAVLQRGTLEELGDGAAQPPHVAVATAAAVAAGQQQPHRRCWSTPQLTDSCSPIRRSSRLGLLRGASSSAVRGRRCASSFRNLVESSDAGITEASQHDRMCLLEQGCRHLSAQSKAVLWTSSCTWCGSGGRGSSGNTTAGWTALALPLLTLAAPAAPLSEVLAAGKTGAWDGHMSIILALLLQ
jgi:hypothetical protein